MLSAHGSAPEVVLAAEDRGSVVIDAVCPLVTKVHHEVKSKSADGYRIVYVGHAGHEEAVGTMAVAPQSIHRVESVSEVEALEQFDEPVALLAQTTLSHRDWSDVADAAKEKFPDIFTPTKSDLCFATTNRQAALMEVANRCNAFVVIGSANSSNTNALAKLASESGCETVIRVNGPDELTKPLEGVVGVTAGASAPERVVQAVIEKLAPIDGIEGVEVTVEDEYFPPPRSLRTMLHGAEAAIAAALGGINDPERRGLDKNLDASSVLTD